MNISKITSNIGTAIKNIKPLDVATKGAGVFALLSVLNESNKIGVAKASEKSQVWEADKAISLGIGAGKLNYESEKYSKIKEDTYKYYPYGIGKAFHGLKGYFEGFYEGTVNNVLTIGFSVLALLSKHKPVKIASLVGLLGSIGYYFVKNGTNLFEKTDQLKDQ